MRITARVRTWFANWRASRKRTTWDAGKDASDWDTGDVSLLGVMARNQRMRHIADDWNENVVEPIRSANPGALVLVAAALLTVAASVVVVVIL